MLASSVFLLNFYGLQLSNVSIGACALAATLDFGQYIFFNLAREY